MKALGWYAAIAIGIAVLGIELLPVLLGTGEEAILDWSFTYVTFRFVLIPIACSLHVVVNLGILLFWRDRPRIARLTQFASIVIPVAFLTLSYLYPLPLFDRFL